MVTIAANFDDAWTLNPRTGCFVWQRGDNGVGYGQLWVAGNTVLAHRFAWERVNGVIPEGLLVCHTCDVPACVNVAHLFLGTQSDNMRDAARKGRIARGAARGERHTRAILTDNLVHDFHRLRRWGVTYKQISRIYGVKYNTVWRAINTNWPHIRAGFLHDRETRRSA